MEDKDRKYAVNEGVTTKNVAIPFSGVLVPVAMPGEEKIFKAAYSAGSNNINGGEKAGEMWRLDKNPAALIWIRNWSSENRANKRVWS